MRLDCFTLACSHAAPLSLEAGGIQKKFALAAGSNPEIGVLEPYQFGDNSSFPVDGERFDSKEYRVQDVPMKPPQ